MLGGALAGAIIATRPPGYVVYEGYSEPVHAPGCYWASQPLLDPAGQVIGYTGEPVQVCPGYAEGELIDDEAPDDDPYAPLIDLPPK